MADGIGRIFGNTNYGINGYVSQKKEEETAQTAAQTPAKNYEETQVDPSKVMAFLESNNIFITPQAKVAQTGVDPETQARVAGYMEQFEMIYGIVQQEFGDEDAPMVMDFVMDSLMGMVA